ncbi:LANO_0D10176g1_1 [Lachancea nothofagi CBS 11611]|uniref:LANO_0D10176g1_1 n=1 Tax=Lachancea nothofagi CBS 11611 TaxID=1266666 RepID=A0A1G4JKA2_9SACH|nr:LANO_0D10176g1_1 [Lachancea nothofagi CBS 11611]
MSESSIPFPDIDPYQVLQVQQSVSETELRKCYRKLMLRYHPDKTKDWTPEAKEKFHKIQFAFEILEKFRDVYDKTGSVEACFNGTDLENWKDLFDTDVVIDKDTIEQDKVKYRGSSDETQDICDSWRSNEQEKPKKRYVPDEDQFALLFQEIPHVEANEEDEGYIYDRVSKMLKDGLIQDNNGSFARWTQNRAKYLKGLQNRLAKEAKLAASMLSDMKSKSQPVDDEDQLRQLIQKKNKTSFDSLISKLESQAVAKGQRKGKKNKRAHAEIDDEEFAKLRAKVTKRRG